MMTHTGMQENAGCIHTYIQCLKPAMSSSVTEHQARSIREEWRALLGACPVG